VYTLPANGFTVGEIEGTLYDTIHIIYIALKYNLKRKNINFDQIEISNYFHIYVMYTLPICLHDVDEVAPTSDDVPIYYI
jgi:hypothetical protein